MRGLDSAIVLVLLCGCGREQLESGRYLGSLTGTVDRLEAGTEAFQEEVSIDVSLVDGSGIHEFEVFVCEGLTEFQSSTPCFASIRVRHSADGLLGEGTTSWGDLALDTGATTPLTSVEGACSGTESIALQGEVLDPKSATVELIYHLLINGDDDCNDEIGDAAYRIEAKGRITRQ